VIQDPWVYGFGPGVCTEFRFPSFFFAILTLFVDVYTPVLLKILVKIPKKFLCVLDHFLDIFVMLLCVKS
jgi:hypothetical protein